MAKTFIQNFERRRRRRRKRNPEKPKDDAALASLRITPVFDGTTLRKLVDYPVLVEMWSKKKNGRWRRAYESTFTESERAVLARHHATLRRWCLITGVPKTVQLSLADLALLQRAVNFFGML